MQRNIWHSSACVEGWTTTYSSETLRCENLCRVGRSTESLSRIIQRYAKKYLAFLSVRRGMDNNILKRGIEVKERRLISSSSPTKVRRMPPVSQSIIYLRPAKGPALVLQDKETWIGRGTFEMSEQCQKVCSRRQACLKRTDTLELECHGLNAIYFVACYIVGFHANEDTPMTDLYMLKKGEVMELSDGDKFYLAPRECLLTVGIKHIKPRPDETAELASDAANTLVHNDGNVADQIKSPNVTHVDHTTARFCVDEARLLGASSSAGTSSNEIRDPCDRHLTEDNRSLVSADVECLTCCPGDGCKCEVKGGTLVPVVPGLEARLKTDGSNTDVNSVPTGSAAKTISPKDAGKSTAVGSMPFPAEVCGYGASSVPAGSGSAMGREHFPSDNSREHLAEDFEIVCVGVDSALPSRQPDKDRSCNNEARDRITRGSGTRGERSEELSDLNQFRDADPSTQVCKGDSEHGCPQGLLPHNSDRLSPVARALHLPCATSHAEVSAVCENRVSENHEKTASLQGTTVLSPKSERCIPDPAGREAGLVKSQDVTDGVNIQSRQPSALVLSERENKREMCVQFRSESCDEGQCNFGGQGAGPVQDMETVVATVSGYDNLLRTRLISLINYTGAVYTGSLTKANTHVVCYKFKGAKYELARKLGKRIINHRWFEDCLRTGMRLSEGAYETSGESVQPLVWDSYNVQNSSPKEDFISKQCCPPSNEGHAQSPARAAVMIGGESSVLRMGNDRIPDGIIPGALRPRRKFSEHDKGKEPAVINLSSPTRSGDGQVIDLTSPHRAREQESDEFWNEVIRTCDKGKQVAERSFQVSSHAPFTEELNEERRRRTDIVSSSTARSSSGDRRLNVADEVVEGRGDPVTLAFATGEPESRQQTMQRHSPVTVREEPGCEYSESDVGTSYPMNHRKRDTTSANMDGDVTRKLRRLVRKREVVSIGTSDDAVEPRGNLDSLTGSLRTGDEGGAVTDSGQRRVPTVDGGDEFQPSTVIKTGRESASEIEKVLGGSVASDEIKCVICHSEAKPVTEGVLPCGHLFCYPCIQRWADESRRKSPTCPLCKVPFEFITYREIGTSEADKPYSTVLEEKIVQIGQDLRQEAPHSSLPVLRTETLCVTCGSRDTSELLLICSSCSERACHTFCLDPPRSTGSSWLCSRCSQMQSRAQTREAYGRLFQGIPSESPLRRHPDFVDLEIDTMRQSTFGSRVGASAGGQSSRTPPRRGRQHSLYNYMVRRHGE